MVNSTWSSSHKGDLSFGSTHMTGWELVVKITQSATATEIDQWTCHYYNATESVLVVK